MGICLRSPAARPHSLTSSKRDMTKIPSVVSEYMAKIGAKGGARGKGVRKTRKKIHYKRIGKVKKPRDGD